jgi:hypothetical protein
MRKERTLKEMVHAQRTYLDDDVGGAGPREANRADQEREVLGDLEDGPLGSASLSPSGVECL